MPNDTQASRSLQEKSATDKRPQLLDGRVDWQKFGKDWAITGQYGVRPIFFIAPEKSMRLLNEHGILIPFDPDHPVARGIVRACNAHDALVAACEAARRTLIAAVGAGVDLPDFDPAEHVTVKQIDAALRRARLEDAHAE